MTLATSIFGLSIALNVYLLIFSGMFGGSSSRQDVLVEGERTQTIAVIPVEGMITADTAAQFDRFLSLAESNSNVKGVLIEIDSPGGTVTASDEIYNRIVRFRQARQGVPVYAAMASMAASGGYYVACGATDLYAQPTTITGSIGVLMPNFNLSGLMNEWGIEETTIESTGADFKNAGSMFRPPDPVETAYLQRIADAMFDQFKSVIVQSRGGKLTSPIDQIANGKVYLTGEALTLGLIDHQGYLKDAIDALSSKLSLGKPHVVRYSNPPTLFDMLSARSGVSPASSSSSSSSSASQSININGVHVNVDLGDLAELTTPRLMYLWRGR